jgi:hypothetical protein
LLAAENHQSAYMLLGTGIVCLFGGIASAIFTQTRSRPIMLEKRTEV